jgi:quercetin dioxygenase-like cupin family protein
VRHRFVIFVGCKFPATTPKRLAALAIQAESGFDESVFPYVALNKEKVWQPGPYQGVELMVLHENEETGGLVVIRKFQAGYTIPAHTHPDANEWAYLLSGEWEESGTVYTTGTLFFAPKGVRHGPHIARTEVISLTMFDGPLMVA